VSTTVTAAVALAPAGRSRLLEGVRSGDPAVGLAAHDAQWGPVQTPGLRLIDALDASGLVGHGGAHFPVARKWRAVAAAGRSPVVVANGAEGEPASRKDLFLLTQLPHLVLDGLSAAASALGASRAVAYVPAHAVGSVSRALDEREYRNLDAVGIELVEAPAAFLAGQESAVVNALQRHKGARARPTFVDLVPVRERGVDGRPSLVQNVETLAHVALVARFGADWFRRVGVPDAPGTMLLTLTRPEGFQVVEAVFGAPLTAATGWGQDDLARTAGVLLGGYGGGWVTTSEFEGLHLSEKEARRRGATLGPGIVAPLPRHSCPLAEMAHVVRYMEGEGAGQCGPCVHGLADLADALEHLAYGRARAVHQETILAICNLVDGRGACRHPDGVARFVRSGLRVFADEVSIHHKGGACRRVHAERCLPVPSKVPTRRLVSRA
jgi:NADH:ubiquinone oxidoreductase subunit F (NADH-binding)